MRLATAQEHVLYVIVYSSAFSPNCIFYNLFLFPLCSALSSDPINKAPERQFAATAAAVECEAKGVRTHSQPNSKSWLMLNL